MHRSIKLICPRCVGKQPLDAQPHFVSRRHLSNYGRETLADFFSTLRKIFGSVEQHLRSIVRRRFSPAFGLARGFHRVAYVFSIAKRRFAQQCTRISIHRYAVSRIRPRLFSANVKLHGAVDSARRIRHLRRSIFCRRSCNNYRRISEPRRLQIFEQSFSTAFAPETAFAIAPKSTRRVKQIRAVHPHHAGFDLCRRF